MFKRLLVRLLGIALVISLMVAAILYRLRPAPLPPWVGEMRKKDDLHNPHDWSWKQEAWTGDNRPYQAARAEIDRRLQGQPKPAEVVRLYHRIADKYPENALAQF